MGGEGAEEAASHTLLGHYISEEETSRLHDLQCLRGSMPGQY